MEQQLENTVIVVKSMFDTRPALSSAALTLCGPMMLVCPYIMFVCAVLKQIPNRIGFGVSSAQSYPSPLADRGTLPMETV